LREAGPAARPLHHPRRPVRPRDREACGRHARSARGRSEWVEPGCAVSLAAAYGVLSAVRGSTIRNPPSAFAWVCCRRTEVVPPSVTTVSKTETLQPATAEGSTLAGGASWTSTVTALGIVTVGRAFAAVDETMSRAERNARASTSP